jgi:hypothetical protein
MSRSLAALLGTAGVAIPASFAASKWLPTGKRIVRDRAVRIAARVLGIVGVALLAGRSGQAPRSPLPYAIVTAIVAILAGASFVALRRWARRRDGENWEAFEQGRIGREDLPEVLSAALDGWGLLIAAVFAASLLLLVTGVL